MWVVQLSSIEIELIDYSSVHDTSITHNSLEQEAQCHGSEKNGWVSSWVNLEGTVLQIYIQVGHCDKIMASIATSTRPMAGFVEALQSFVTAMEPEASFTMLVEEQAGEDGMTTTPIYTQIL